MHLIYTREVQASDPDRGRLNVKYFAVFLSLHEHQATDTFARIPAFCRTLQLLTALFRNSGMRREYQRDTPLGCRDVIGRSLVH
jgi:hypothetical protein